MSTFKELIDLVLTNIQGDSLDQDEQTFLIDPVTDTDTVFRVDEPTQISQGLCEINEELVWVKKVDNQAQQVTISPFGRGFRSTIAQSYPVGTAIKNNPRYSRFRVRELVNTSIINAYPDIYGLKTWEFPYVAARLTYELPETLDQIHNISWETVGPSRVWMPVTEYWYVPDADRTMFPSGKAVTISNSIIPGRRVRVTYIDAPNPLINDSDEFTTVTGLAPTAEEAIIYGACYRLVGFVEAPRLQTNSVESSQRSTLVPPGAAMNAGQFFWNLYNICISQERERLLRSNQSIMHRVRRTV